MKVLIVDDSLTVRMDLEEAFGSVGYETTLCATAEAARQALSGDRFQLLVLDVLLPDGDGIELLKELRATSGGADLPVLLLSTEAEVHDRVRGLAIGADDYVGKPYDRSQVIARAAELVGTPAAPRVSPVVLVIDESQTYREVLKEALDSAGYKTILAETGEKGLSLAAGTRPDAVVVDGKLPGVDGATVVRRIRSDVVLRSTPCLFLTTSGNRDDEFLALEAGADAFVRKDEDTQVLLARLAAVLRSAGPRVSPGPERGLLGPKRILTVDDSLTYSQELAAQFRQDGYDVVLARSGEEALELLEVQQVDGILLDVVMPGLSGQETCRRIKTRPAWRDIPLIMLTSREEREDMLDGFEAGADDYISKSSEFEVLRARLRAQLRRKQFEDENRRMREQLIRKEVEAAEARVNKELAETRAKLVEELQRANKELEAFSYSVSHDLRAPLRAINGFSLILLEGYGDKLDDEGKRLLNVVIDNTARMSQLIDGLLNFSRLSRKELARFKVDMTQLATEALELVRSQEPGRTVQVTSRDLAPACADGVLVRQVFINLLSNAFKFSRKQKDAAIEIGSSAGEGQNVYYVKDNGAGFDMQYVDKLFGVFQRLHSPNEFEGTGIGLALVKRVIHRHGGKVWAEGKRDEGATFYFTLPTVNGNEPSPLPSAPRSEPACSFPSAR